MSEELNARNITALSNAVRALRKSHDDNLELIKSLQDTIITLQSESAAQRIQLYKILTSNFNGGSTCM